MRIINGLNYYEKLDIIIKECIQKAQEYPYRQFIFIVEDKEMIEKRFFQYTHFLVNIEIMTWNQYLYRLMLNHHFTYKQPVNNIELTYYLRQILNNNDFYCFHDVNYSLINEMISLMKELELHQTFYEINSNKLKDYMKIYHCLKEYLGNNKYLCLESLFQNIQINEKNIHLYVEADHLYQQARQNILQNLSLNNDMTLLYTHNFDSRLFNKPLHHLCLDANTYTKDTYLTKNLFSQTFKHNHQENKFYTFKASTPQNEVKRVVYTLLEDIVDKQLHYNDFIIVYPNESYKEILLDTLSKENIPHNIKKTTSCLYDKDYQNILNILESTDITQSVQDWSDNLSKEMSDNKYKDYFLILKNNHYISLGKGAYAETYLVGKKGTNEEYAAKVFIKPLNIKHINLLKREILMSTNLNHPCILRYVGFCEHSLVQYIEKKSAREILPTLLMQYIPKGTLENAIKERIESFDDTARLKVIIGIASALNEMFINNIVHRDLKPANILLNDKFEPVIGDLGLSRQFTNLQTNKMTDKIGTPIFMAPELMNYIQGPLYYKSEVDVYSFGIILFQILTFTKTK